jgi:hypothetical protein
MAAEMQLAEATCFAVLTRELDYALFAKTTNETLRPFSADIPNGDA